MRRNNTHNPVTPSSFAFNSNAVGFMSGALHTTSVLTSSCRLNVAAFGVTSAHIFNTSGVLSSTPVLALNDCSWVTANARETAVQAVSIYTPHSLCNSIDVGCFDRAFAFAPFGPSHSKEWMSSSDVEATAATTSEPPLRDVTFTLSEPLSLLTAGLSGKVASQETGVWHSQLVKSFRTWQQSAEQTDHKLFWNVFDAVERVDVVATTFCSLFGPVSTGKSVYLRDWLDAQELLKGLPDWREQRDLSARDIKSILSAIVYELKTQQDLRSAASVIASLRETMKREVRQRTKWR